jgi:hypothetical protein
MSLFIVIVLGGAILIWSKAQQPAKHCDFSPTLRQQVGSLKLYCLNASKLPAGVTTQSSRATYGNGAVLFPIQDGANTLSVTLQPKPTKDQLTNFTANLIPLHFDVNTPVGKAQTGISQGRSLTSLPTNTSTWIILTAPKDYNIDRLTKILKAFQAD